MILGRVRLDHASLGPCGLLGPRPMVAANTRRRPRSELSSRKFRRCRGSAARTSIA